MKIESGKRLELDIKKITYPGVGLATFNNHVISVPHAVPGDIVEVIVRKRKKTYTGTIQQFTSRSQLRDSAQCSHYSKCGGCQQMDIPYHHQLELKEQSIKESLEAIHPNNTQKVATIIPNQSHVHYRNKMEFAFTKTNDNIAIGLKEAGRFDSIVPIHTCHIQHPSLTPIMAKLLEELNTYSELTVWDPIRHVGVLRHCVLRHSYSKNQTLINIIVSEPITEILHTITQTLAKEFDQLSGSLMSINSSIGDHTQTESTTILHGTDTLHESIGTLNFCIPASAFFQTNTNQTHVLYSTIKKLANFKPSDELLDLYCGIGTISLFCADSVSSVTGIEEHPAAIQMANINKQENGITNTQFYEGRVKNILKFNSFNPSVIIIDPPRAGMVPKAIKRTIEMNAKKIIYVSCNPNTCWRDIIEFRKSGYTLKTIQPIDMFPNTFHVETVTVLEK